MTFGPDRPSCLGVATRLKLAGLMPGFWICTVTVRPADALPIAAQGATDLRPLAITRSGHGAFSISPDGFSAFRGKGQKAGGRDSHG